MENRPLRKTPTTCSYFSNLNGINTVNRVRVIDLPHTGNSSRDFKQHRSILFKMISTNPTTLPITDSTSCTIHNTMTSKEVALEEPLLPLESSPVDTDGDDKYEKRSAQIAKRLCKCICLLLVVFCCWQRWLYYTTINTPIPSGLSVVTPTDDGEPLPIKALMKQPTFEVVSSLTRHDELLQEQDAVFIMYYFNWCPFAEIVMPEWELLAVQTKYLSVGDVNIPYRVAAADFAGLGDDFHKRIQGGGSPTFRLYYHGKALEVEDAPLCNDNRTAECFSTYAQTALARKIGKR